MEIFSDGLSVYRSIIIALSAYGAASVLLGLKRYGVLGRLRHKFQFDEVFATTVFVLIFAMPGLFDTFPDADKGFGGYDGY